MLCRVLIAVALHDTGTLMVSRLLAAVTQLAFAACASAAAGGTGVTDGTDAKATVIIEDVATGHLVTLQAKYTGTLGNSLRCYVQPSREGGGRSDQVLPG